MVGLNIYLPSVGSFEGIICIWDKDQIVAEYHVIRDFPVTQWCIFVGDDKTWMVTNVYGPVLYAKKEAF